MDLKVLITGSMGLIGRATAEHFIQKGWEVRLTDIVTQDVFPDSIYSVCDITNYDAVFEQMQGCNAVVHMAALRNPYYAPGQEVFRINVAGTVNVYEAAAKLGIRRIVQASSINAIGCAWNIGDFSPQYFPVDEHHPRLTSDPYSFSKQMIEDVGDYYWRRDGISGLALRFPGVYQAQAYKSPQFYERRDTTRHFLDEFLSQPEADQQQQLAEVRQRMLAYRRERPMEYPNTHPKPGNFEGINELLWKIYTYDRFNLWTCIDVRDAVQSIEKGLTVAYEGSHPLFVNDHHNLLDYDSHTLARVFFPEVTQWTQPVSGSESLVSINRARDLIGFEPAYSLYGDEQA